MFENFGLVLEGGGMRGVFTSGVLDCFLDNDIIFPYVIGVSAGGSNGLSYASRQRGRAKRCNIDVLRARPYIGLKFMLTQGCIMDYEFLFNELPLRIVPYDFQAYLKCGRFILVATNCLTGHADYFENLKTERDLLLACRASCSMPYVTTVVKIDGVPYLDGGIADAVPIRRAIADGFGKNVVVLTRNNKYRKHEKFPCAMRWLYYKYPHLRESLKCKNDNYNATLDYIDELERRGDVVVIRPERDLEVSRLGKNCNQLQALYDEGYACASKCIASR